MTVPTRPDDDLGFHLPEPPRVSRARIAVAAVLALCFLGAAFAGAYIPRKRDRAALEARSVAGEGPLRVDVVAPKIGSSHAALTLPGSVQALQETIIYSRANGYVHRWLVDIGDTVADGQLLAELDTPELDQQIDQARAQLEQARAAVGQASANRAYSKSTFERYQPLTEKGVASQQDLEQRRAQAAVDEANVQVADATVSAQEANMRRLVQLKSFARVLAPFAGRITTRSVEIGTLVTGGSSALFKLAATDPARVFVQVPQDVAPSVRAGQTAKVTVREYPGKPFAGTITRASGELESSTRTMTTEVRVPNPDGALLPGMYAQVMLDLPLPHRVFEIPSTAVANDSKGMRVALIGPESVVRMVPILVERDTGSAIEVASGLSESDRVVRLVSPALTEGRAVTVVDPAAQTK